MANIRPIVSSFGCLITGVFCFFAVGVLPAQSSSPGQVQAIELIRDLRSIHTPNGIAQLRQVHLNGVPQWINIRGKDKNNPIPLFIHGGPASPVMPISWAFQSPWEDFFTVVQWDQRYTGKSWSPADTAQAAQRLSSDLIVQDGLDLIDTLLQELQQDKLFVLGYSFGSRIGIEMAKATPEKIHAFIGMGQVTDLDSEKYLYEELIRLATAASHTTALQELQAMAPYPNPNGSTPVNQLLLARKWARFFNGEIW